MHGIFLAGGICSPEWDGENGTKGDSKDEDDEYDEDDEDVGTPSPPGESGPRSSPRTRVLSGAPIEV
jgi:hypothetical protein